MVAFAIDRNDADLNAGALRQTELFNAYSRTGPVEWDLRFYVGATVPVDLLDRLEALGARIFRRPACLETHTFGFARHHVLLSDYDFYIFRSPHIRLSQRECLALDAFVASGAEFHVMRDHPSHLAPVLPDLWGCTRTGRNRIARKLPDCPAANFFEHVNRWLGSDHTSNDFPLVADIWLWRHVWPQLRKRALIHSGLATSRFHGRYRTCAYPSERAPGEYVGQRFDQHDQLCDPGLSEQIKPMAWLEKRQNTQPPPPRPGNKVTVKLACGLGNNLFQMIAGLALAQRLTAITGKVHPCEIIIPDAVDFTQGYSVFETLGGHLRSDQHYFREHQDFQLPDPANLPAVFPHLSWRDLSAPRPLHPGDLTELVSARYFETQRFESIVGDARYANSLLLNQSRVVNCHFWPTVYPFPMYYWYPEILEARALFNPSAAVNHYIHAKYGLSSDSPMSLVGLHIRNDLRVPDIHRTDAVSRDWIISCIEDAVARVAPGTPILIVSNQVANNAGSRSSHLTIINEIARRHPANPILSSTLEPYYVDFFLLRMCTHLISSCSTFSFAAGLTSTRLQKMYVPDSFSERHFMDGKFPEFCVFMPEEGRDI